MPWRNYDTVVNQVSRAPYGAITQMQHGNGLSEVRALDLNYRTRNADFSEADRAAGYNSKNKRPKGYTWHHHHDSGYMQLVPTDIHAAVGHTGSIAKKGK